MMWSCRCGEVNLELKGKPLYNIDCHSLKSLQVVQYMDHKADGVSGSRGISAISATGLGEAKSFYLLENVSFLTGQEKLQPFKRAAGGHNVRMYTSCCQTLCVCDSGKRMAQPWRSFNRNAIQTSDGTAYVPSDAVCNANGADNPDFDKVPEPKATGLPADVVAKLDAVWHADLEPPERDEHAGQWAPPPTDAVGADATGSEPFFYMDADKVEEIAVAMVGLENALADFIEKERERAAAEKAAADAKAAEEARLAAEAAAKAAEEAEEEAILSTNPMVVKLLRDQGKTDKEIVEHLRNQLAEELGGADKLKALKGADKSNIEQLIEQMKNQMMEQSANAEPEYANEEVALLAKNTTVAKYDADAITAQAREIADQAFKRYDIDGNGTIDKEELFDMCLTVGQVAPSGASIEDKREYLEKQWALADTDGDGTVDFEEFVEFYVCTLEALAAEEAARHAFNRYDVDGSNSLEKHELFQALFELDMVPGHDAYEKRVYLEEQFVIADTNGDGVVDFAEFVAFYTAVLHDSRKSEFVFERRRKNKKAREERSLRAKAYIEPEQLIVAVKKGELALLSARWLLERAGYEKKEVERRGVMKVSWSKKGEPVPLEARQELEAKAPEAFFSAEALEKEYGQYKELCAAGGKAFEVSAIAALPVVLTSFVWMTPEHADPEGEILGKVAANLARQMPTFASWGFDDVGVFVDWACMYQAVGSLTRTAQQDGLYNAARKHLQIYISHRMTTVYLVDDQPSRPANGWAFFEEALCALFKETPPSKPYKVRSGQLVPFWAKVVNLSDPALADDAVGANPQAGMAPRKPPLSAPHFIDELKKREPGMEAQKRDLLIHLYREAIEDGFNSLDKLVYSRLNWTDADVSELASALEEVPCPNVQELDLSWNDMREGTGLEAIGKAIGLGALHGLQKLNLINCTAIKTLPGTLEELLELNTILLDGCVQMKSVPDGISRLASLRVFSIINCHYMDDEACKDLPSLAKVIRTKEEAAAAGL